MCGCHVVSEEVTNSNVKMEDAIVTITLCILILAVVCMS